MKHVARFGIELEGAWDERPLDYEECYREDPSVRTNGKYASGELASPPIAEWKTGAAFLDNNYPERVGSSCGMHVHVSFHQNSRAISALLDSEMFQVELLAMLRNFGTRHKVTARYFWDRVEGDNEFCETHWHPDGILNNYQRYRAVNFASFHRHGTVEIRVLPMFRNQSISKKAIRRLLVFIDEYVDKAFRAEPEDESFGVTLTPRVAVGESLRYVVELPDDAPVTV